MASNFEQSFTDLSKSIDPNSVQPIPISEVKSAEKIRSLEDELFKLRAIAADRLRLQTFPSMSLLHGVEEEANAFIKAASDSPEKHNLSTDAVIWGSCRAHGEWVLDQDYSWTLRLQLDELSPDAKLGSVLVKYLQEKYPNLALDISQDW